MKNILNNFIFVLNNSHYKILIFILGSLAFVELLALVYAINIISLYEKEKKFLDESKSWDYYILGTYLSQLSRPYYGEETIKAFGKYLILDPQLKIANKVLSTKYRSTFDSSPNICLSSIVNQKQVDTFYNLKLKSDTAYIQRGKIRFQLGDYQGSINDFEEATNLNIKNKSTLSKSIALAYFELGNPKYENKNRDIERHLLSETRRPGFLFDELKEYSSSAIDFNPNFAHAYYLRGYLRFFAIKSYFSLEEVRWDKQKVKRINNAIKMGIFDDPGKNRIFSEDMLEMINDLTQAIRNDPFFYKNYPINTITPCPVFSDEYSTLIETLTKEIKINPNNPSLYHQRALIYLDINNNQKSIEDLNKALELSYNDDIFKAVIYYNRWLIFYKEEKYKKAIEEISQVIKIYPDFADFYAIRALTYYDFSKLLNKKEDREKVLNEKVIEDCNHAIKLHEELLKKLNPKEDSRFLDARPHANAYFIRGLAYYDLGNQTQALSDYLEALPEGSSSMWPSLVHGYEGGGIREIPLPAGFPP